MANILILLPFVLGAIVFLIKVKVVKTEDGSKSAKNEVMIDISKFILIYSTFILAELYWEFELLKPSALMIDSIMVALYITIILRKNENYKDRKVIGAMVSMLILAILTIIVISQMLFGTYNSENSWYLIAYLKIVMYFLIFTWAAFTAESKSLKEKIKDFIQVFKQSYKQRNLSRIEYLGFGFITLMIFLGGPNEYIIAFGAYGIHEIMNRKTKKGIMYIVIGNIILFSDFSNISNLLYSMYILIALIDLMWSGIKFKSIQKASLN